MSDEGIRLIKTYERSIGWCERHDDLAWRYTDGSVSCHYCLIVESSSDACSWVELPELQELRDRITGLRAQVENRDVIAAVFDGEEERLRAELERERTQNRELRAAIEDIDAHATPLGTDDDGFVTTGYLVSVGAIHRALGIVRGRAALSTPPNAADERVPTVNPYRAAAAHIGAVGPRSTQEESKA